MGKESDVRNIADASKPNAGRIYDYLLGGNHNFEIDRQVAKQILQVAPHMPGFFRLIRWFLGEATRRLLDEGFTKFLDFASGLPTMDHIHQIAPKGTKVIYSDVDPVTVAYAHDIIGENKDIRFVVCDVRKPEEILKSGVVEELFGNDRKIAIGLNGIAYFLTDDEFSNSVKVLYDWADKGSRLFLCDSDVTASKTTEDGEKTLEIYKQMGQPLYLRTLQKTKELIAPWTIEEPGFLLVENWIEMDKKLTEKAEKTWGSGALNGAILKK